MAVKYYIATPEGKTEGPFYLETLEVMKRRKSIACDTLICKEGGHEWIRCDELLTPQTSSEYSTAALQRDFHQQEGSQIAGAFRGVGIVCFVLAVLVPLLLLIGGSGQTIFAAAIFLVLALSGLGWLGVGVIIRLLEQIAENTGKK